MMLSCLNESLPLFFPTISFGVQIEYWWIGFIHRVISFGLATHSGFAGLGVNEVEMVVAYSLLGVPTSIALAVALVAHLIHNTLTVFVGMCGIFRDGEFISSLSKRLRNVRYLVGMP